MKNAKWIISTTLNEWIIEVLPVPTPLQVVLLYLPHSTES